MSHSRRWGDALRGSSDVELHVQLTELLRTKLRARGSVGGEAAAMKISDIAVMAKENHFLGR